MGKTAKQESDKGFDTSTYVGMHVRQDLVDIDDPKASSGVSKVPFDEAGGKYHGGTQWVSDIANPPNEILVNFITNQSAIPGGLTSSSVASFNDKIRLVLLYLKEVPSVVIKIRAYTDAAGSPKGNDELSKKRAQSAKEYLIDKNIWTGKEKTPAAVEPGRIILVEGKGQEEAEKALKQKYPSDWEKRIGTEKAADEKSRRLEIEYIAR
jgi:outer membrane protein OmpA-like peptidoglycan-associated protein